MKLYDIIINSKEVSEEESIKKYAELLNGNPVGKISEEDYRKLSVESMGYDPTTVYDFDRIDKAVDNVADESMSATEIDDLKATIKNRFIEDKDSYVRELVDDELTSKATSDSEEDEDELDEDDSYDDAEDTDIDDDLDSFIEALDGAEDVDKFVF